MAKAQKIDPELERYRTLLEVPGTFKSGFGWSTVVGILFCGIIMMPGSIYLGLMTGGDMTSAATWVTLILFGEIARRAVKPLSKQNLVVLYHAANVMMIGYMLTPGGPIGPLVHRAFLIGSDAVRDAGMRSGFPSWWVPSPDSPAITERALAHPDWIVPIAVVVFLAVVGIIKKYTLGYFFFRVTSDIERLPFPLAPVAAQGVMALSEGEQGGGDASGNDGKPKATRWRLFSLGACFGILFGLLQVGVPAITGIFLEKPIFLIPQPFVDTTTISQGILPATPTGITIDPGIVILGFVLPFWAVVGTFCAIVLTLILNPILYHSGVLTQWQPGMDTVNTTFANSVDFWMSFSIGSGIGIAAISFYSVIRDTRKRMRELREQRAAAGISDVASLPEGRGDYPLWLALVIYCVTAGGVVALCHVLVPQLPLVFLLFFTFIYSPLLSYVNARLLGIAGQTVDIPYVKEGSFILSGAKGVDIWLAPVPIENYGFLAQAFRVNELTGVNFRSLFKAELVAVPVLLVCSFVFWSFIWKTNEIPSPPFPAAQVRWELASKQSALLWSSTFVPEGQDPASVEIGQSEFMKAIHPKTIGTGFAFTTVLFAALSALGWPVMLVYGFIRGMGELPHTMIVEIVGAMLGRFYFQRKFGAKNFLQMAPTILAGYFTGVGLIAMGTISLSLIKQSLTVAPF